MPQHLYEIRLADGLNNPDYQKFRDNSIRAISSHSGDIAKGAIVAAVSLAVAACAEKKGK